MALAVFLLYGVSNAAQGARQIDATRPWALEVLTFKPTASTTLWVGLINRSSEARLVCVLDRGISYSEKDGTSKAEGDGGGPHACDVDEQFQLVRAGQTQFISLPLPVTLADKISGPLRVGLDVIERPTERNVPRGEAVAVTWKGTLQEAAAHGRALSARAKGAK